MENGISLRGEAILDDVELQPKLMPLGIVFFDKGKQTRFIFQDVDDNIKQANRILNKEDQRKQQFLEPNRVIDLSYCSDITLIQIPFGDEIKITYPDTIERKAPAFIRIAYKEIPAFGQNIEKDGNDHEYLSIDELPILEALAGNSGGIVVFKGGNVPLANAIVVQKTHEQDTSALIMLFAPKEDHQDNYEIRSTEAMVGFFTRLNDEFKQFMQHPFYQAVLEAYKKNPPAFSNPNRESFYLSTIIANARLYYYTHDEKYKKFLDKHLPGFSNSLYEKLLVFLRMRKVTQEHREQTVDQIIFHDSRIADNESLSSHAQPPETAKQLKNTFLLDDLMTEEAKFVRKHLSNNFGVEKSLMMDAYFSTLADLIVDARSPEVLNDVGKLFQELSYTPYGKRDRCFLFNKNKVRGQRLQFVSVWDPDSACRPTKRIIEILQTEIYKKSVELQSKGGNPSV